jgi:hypothetical protein
VTIMNSNRRYLRAGRLPDVVALLQVLGLDETSHRSESGLRDELQRSPLSADSWTEVANQHPEFFRVRPKGDHVVSLLARHVSPRGEVGRPPLTTETVKELVNVALSIHDRELTQSRAWHVWLPLAGVVLGATLVWALGQLA